MLRLTMTSPMGSQVRLRADGDYTPEVVEDLLRRGVDALLRIDRASADIAIDAGEDADDEDDDE